MTELAPVAVALPLLGAAVVVALPRRLPQAAFDAVVLATASACLGLVVTLAVQATDAPVVTWVGGWRPRGEVAIGIALVADRLGTGAALLAAGLTLASLLYAIRWYADVRPIHQALALIFLAGMVDFCLAGDLFNLFVALELMGVAAFALAASKVEDAAVLQGGLHFAVTNTIGAMLVLTGITLVYARTGALNLAQAALVLSRGEPDVLVRVAWALLVGGLLVKAAAVPFHFWLGEVHAVAPTPICVLFSGVMVQLGLLGIARVHGSVFRGALLGDEGSVRSLLVGLGAATAIVGGAMALRQHHLKRQLAFSTVAHVGVALTGLGLLDPTALGGAARYVLGHGLAKGALFMTSGVLLQRCGSVDVGRLHGRGRGLPLVAAVHLLATLALLDLPPFVTAPGRAAIDGGAAAQGRAWVPWTLSVATALAGAAVLRSWGRVFLGLGHPAFEDEEVPDVPTGRELASAVPSVAMRIVPLALVVLAIVAGISPSLPGWADAAGRSVLDPAGQVRDVLGIAAPLPRAPVVRAREVGHGPLLVTVAAAILVAAHDLARPGPHARLGRVDRLADAIGDGLGAVHTGLVGDQVLWILGGTTFLGACLVWAP